MGNALRDDLHQGTLKSFHRLPDSTESVAVCKSASLQLEPHMVDKIKGTMQTHSSHSAVLIRSYGIIVGQRSLRRFNRKMRSEKKSASLFYLQVNTECFWTKQDTWFINIHLNVPQSIKGSTNKVFLKLPRPPRGSRAVCLGSPQGLSFSFTC